MGSNQHIDMGNNSSSGIGVAGLLGVAFVILKLCGVIDWSWWWVTCPFWAGLAILVAILLTVAFGALAFFSGLLVVLGFSKRKEKKKK